MVIIVPRKRADERRRKERWGLECRLIGKLPLTFRNAALALVFGGLLVVRMFVGSCNWLISCLFIGGLYVVVMILHPKKENKKQRPMAAALTQIMLLCFNLIFIVEVNLSM